MSRLMKVEEGSRRPSIYYRVRRGDLLARVHPLTRAKVVQEGAGFGKPPPSLEETLGFRTVMLI